MTDEEIEKMTPLERARYEASLPHCVNCANCVEVGGCYYCETNGKMLIPKFMNIGRCMEVPSKYKKKESYMERLTPKDLMELLNMPQNGDTTRFLFYAKKLWDIENKLENGQLIELPLIVNTLSPKYKVIVFRGKDGKIYKTHQFETRETEARLKELREKGG